MYEKLWEKLDKLKYEWEFYIKENMEYLLRWKKDYEKNQKEGANQEAIYKQQDVKSNEKELDISVFVELCRKLAESYIMRIAPLFDPIDADIRVNEYSKTDQEEWEINERDAIINEHIKRDGEDIELQIKEYQELQQKNIMRKRMYFINERITLPEAP